MATEVNNGQFEPPVDLHISLFPRLERAGRFVAGLFNQLHHEGLSDHHFEHPLDTPIKPATSKDWPNQNRWDDMGNYMETEA